MARGTNSGCDVAPRPRGSARVARAGDALGAQSGRVTRGRPCGPPRIGSVIGGIETITRRNSLPYLYASVTFIFSVWDYVPTRSYLAGDVDAWRASDPLTDGYDRVDPSPRDHQISTCLIYIVSEAIGWLT